MSLFKVDCANVYIAVRHPDVAIFKCFLIKQQCEEFIAKWNKDPEQSNNQLHMETYSIEQEWMRVD